MQQQQKAQNQPYFNMILTLSTHNPFLINNKDYYEKLYNQRLNSGILTKRTEKKWAAAHKNQLISVLNADDAMKGFFENYSKRPDFKNNFVITGDHSMPEITLESKIDRFHVPLLIYSPLLKESKRFYKTVSHFDIAPSILAYYRNNYQINTLLQLHG